MVAIKSLVRGDVEGETGDGKWRLGIRDWRVRGGDWGGESGGEESRREDGDRG